MTINELPTIKISVVAPPHSGKTTLITLLYEYLTKIKVSDDTFAVSCTKNKYRLDDYLSQIRNNKEVPKSLIDGLEFEFEFTIQTFSRTISQKIVILDADGEMINNWNGGCGVYEKGKPALRKYRQHLHESQILLLPIDMPVIIEDDSPHFIKSSSALNYENIKAIIAEWQSYRKESNENCIAHLVVTKCETYYSRENAKIQECEKKVHSCFESILTEMYKAQNISIHYTPVFTSGFNVFNKAMSQWKQIGNTKFQYEEVFDNNSKRVKPFGINDIWNSIFDHMAFNMSNHLKMELSNQSFVSFGTDETKEIAIKAIDFFMKIMELKTENINDNFNYNKILKPRWKKNT